MPAAAILLSLLPLVSRPAAADTSAPFLAYIVAVGAPYNQNGGGGVPMLRTPLRRASPIVHTRSSARLKPHAAMGDGTYIEDCFSDDGTIPDFVAGIVAGTFLQGLTSCEVGSSFSVPINLATTMPSDNGTASGKVTGSMASLSLDLSVAPFGSTVFMQAGVVVTVMYAQVFDSPVPPGSQLTFKYSGSQTLPIAGVAVFSDCSDPGCLESGGPSGSGLNSFQVGPVTIGPSGTYTVVAEIVISTANTAGLLGPEPPPPYNAIINLGCGLQAIPTPAPGSIPALGLPGNNWSFNYDIGSNDGLEIKGVKFGNRAMATQMSVPYVNITTTDFNGTNCQLAADGSGDCASKLVYFQSGTNDVTAIYVMTNIPSGTSSCLAITENFEFDPPSPGDMCEPSGNAGCARYFPTVQYQYLPDEDGKSVTEVDIPMRIQYTVGNPASSLLTTNQAQYSAIANDNNVTGFMDFFNGNPVQKEVFIPNVINQGQTGSADAYYQTYLPKIDAQSATAPPPTPDCPTCAQIHWRWPLIFSGVPGFSDDNNGNPLIPDGSTQSVDVAIVAYPDNQQVSCSNLAAGHQLSGLPTVFWYCGKGNQDNDTFFQHGGFFNPVSDTLQSLDIGVTKSGLRVDHSTGLWVQTVTLTNTSETVTGPVALVLGSLSANVTLANADGNTQFVTPKGSPYIFLPLDSSSQLGPGQSITLTLQFANPKNGSITYTAQVYAGGVL